MLNGVSTQYITYCTTSCIDEKQTVKRAHHAANFHIIVR